MTRSPPLSALLALAALFAASLGGLTGCGPPLEEPVILPPGTYRLVDGQAEGFVDHWVRYAIAGQRVARLLVTVPSSSEHWLEADMRAGDVLPVFGTIHRFLDVSLKAVTFTAERPPPGETGFVDPRSLVVAPRVLLTVWKSPPPARPLFIKLDDVVADSTGRLVAHLRSYQGDQPLYVVKPEEFVPFTISAGEDLLVHGRPQRVLAVHAADPARDLPPWIEIASEGIP